MFPRISAVFLLAFASIFLNGCPGGGSAQLVDQNGTVLGEFSIDANGQITGSLTAQGQQLAAGSGAAGGGGGQAGSGAGGGGGGGAAGGCGGNGGDLTGGGGGNAAPPPPGTGAGNTGGTPTDPTAVSGDVQAEIARIQSEYGVALTGDWRPESLQIMENTLAFYKGAEPVLSRLSSIQLTERGNLNNTQGVGAFFQGGRQGGRIVLYGFQQRYGPQATLVDVAQHEIGHYMAISETTGINGWRQGFRNAVNAGPDVSRYGTAQRPEEKYAETWSKLLSTPGDTWFNPPFQGFRATPDTVGRVQQVIQTQLNGQFM